MAEFNDHIGKVLAAEGGYVNDPHDAGGETNFGISKRAYPDLDIANLSEADAKAIYKRDYWDKVKGDDIKDGVAAFLIFDTAVNMGVKRAAKMAQHIAEVLEDGIIGSKSVAAINSYDPLLFEAEYKLAKVDRYRKICNANRSQSKFLLGWLNRVYSH